MRFTPRKHLHPSTPFRIGILKSSNLQITTSPHQQITTSTNQHIIKSPHQHINTSTHHHISRKLNLNQKIKQNF